MMSSPQRRWLLLAALILLTFAVGRVAGWYLKRSQIVAHQQAVTSQVKALGGHYYYDFQLLDEQQGLLADDDDQDCQPHWLARWLGQDWFHDVFYVSFAQFRGFNADGASPAERSEIGDRELVPIALLPELRWLALSGTHVTDSGIEMLAAVPRLERLWLSQTPISDQALVSLSKCNTLMHLDIAGTYTSDRGLEFLLQLPQLRSLSLGSPLMTAQGLARLNQPVSLTELYLDQLPIDPRVIEALAELVSLETLSLRSTSVSDEGFDHLSRLTRLRQVRLDNTAVRDQALRTAASWKDLEELSLRATRITDAGLLELADCRKLQELNLNRTACSLTGILDLLVERQGRTLEEALDIVFDTKANSQGNLISLDLAGIRIVDRELEILSQLAELQWLKIPDNQLTDAGAVRLSRLGLNKLSLLEIGAQQVTSAGLAALASLPKLRNLNLRGANISQPELAELTATHPALRIDLE